MESVVLRAEGLWCKVLKAETDGILSRCLEIAVCTDAGLWLARSLSVCHRFKTRKPVPVCPLPHPTLDPNANFPLPNPNSSGINEKTPAPLRRINHRRPYIPKSIHFLRIPHQSIYISAPPRLFSVDDRAWWGLKAYHSRAGPRLDRLAGELLVCFLDFEGAGSLTGAIWVAAGAGTSIWGLGRCRLLCTQTLCQ